MGKWNLFTTKELKPKGWLKRQLEIQAAGLSGNLDKVWPDIRDSAWIGGDREGWERVPYWLDGFIPMAYLLEDADLIARTQKYIDAILAAQKPDGWICPCTDEKRKTYDSWAVQLISKTLTVHYECSGDERIPRVLYNVLHNYYDLLKSGEIALFDWGKFRWFETFISINFLYRLYPESWLRELAEILKEQGADYASYTDTWKDPMYHWHFHTHIVNLGMMFKAEAVSCDLLGNPYTDEAERLRSILAQYNGTVYESFTGDECLSGISPIQGTELCGIVEQMYSYELLYAYTGDPKWAQRLEVLAFNALPATISDDMWAHQYDQLSNQIAAIPFEGRPIFSTNGRESMVFGLEPNFGCCTANFSQGWPKFALSAFMHRDDEILSGILLPTCLKADGVEIDLATDYPFKNSATYRVKTQKDFTLRIRIPSFAKNLLVNGMPTEAEELVLPFGAGEERTIQLSFEAEPYFQSTSHDLQAVRCGSLIFSVPIAYEPKPVEYVRNGVERKFPYCDYAMHPQSQWQYAYAAKDLAVESRSIGSVPFAHNDPPVVVKAKVSPIDWGYQPRYEQICAEEPRSREPLSEPTEIELYPYGCAKLRLTELPLI